MDIVQNSISAKATLIEVYLGVFHHSNTLQLVIGDNGRGMDKEMLESVTSPFTTTRTTRRVGLGIPLLAAGAQATGGTFHIESRPGEGTRVEAGYVLDNIDRPPIGDFAGTMYTLVVCNPDIDFKTEFVYDERESVLDTREIRNVLGGDVPLDSPDVSAWIKENFVEMFPPEYAEI